VIGLPFGSTHEIVNVVAPVKGTVAAAPEREDSLKLPSGEVSVQLVTPCVFQKTEVRAPSGTDEGTAQITACAGTVGAVDVATVVVAIDFGGFCCSVTCGCCCCCCG